MRRSAILSAALLTAAAVATPAAASAVTPDYKDRYDETFIDPDFCGTGVDVEVHDRGVAQGYESDTAYRFSFNDRATLTYGRKSVTAHSAGHVVGRAQDGTFDVPHTEIVRESGLRVQVRIPGHGVVTADHGLIVYRFTFVPNTDPKTAAEEPLVLGDVEVVKEAGGHPAFQSEVFCEAVTSYFGIPFQP